MQPPHKHVVDNFIAAAAGNTIIPRDLAQGTLNPDPYTNTNNVKAGSKVSFIDLYLGVAPDGNISAGVPMQIDWYVWFNINAQQLVVDPKAIGTSHTKSQVFHQDSCLLAANGGLSPGRGEWHVQIAIPKSWQVLQDGDVISLIVMGTVLGTAVPIDIKYRAIYKEWYP